MPSPRATRPFLLLALSLIALRVEATCYWQNSGVLAIDDPNAIAPDDTACFPDQDNSPCCGTGWTCLSDGVCKITQDDNDFYYRGTCTDRTWDSQQCPGWCFAQNANTSIPLAKCEGDQDWYCCPGDAECSCDTGKNAVKLGAEQPTTVTVIGSTSWPGYTSTTEAFTQQPLNTEGTSTTDDAPVTTTNPSTASATGSNGSPTAEGAQATANTTDTSSGSSDNSSSNDTALAAGLGAGLGAAAVLGAGGIFYLLRRRRRRRDAAGTNAGAANGKGGAYYDNDGERSSGSASAPGFKGGAAAAAAGGTGPGPVHDYYASEGRKPEQQQQQQPPIAELGTPGQGRPEMDSGQRVRAELP